MSRWCPSGDGGPPHGACLSAWLLERAFSQGAQLAHLHPVTDGAARLYAGLGFVPVRGFDVYVDL